MVGCQFNYLEFEILCAKIPIKSRDPTRDHGDGQTGQDLLQRVPPLFLGKGENMFELIGLIVTIVFFILIIAILCVLGDIRNLLRKIVEK